MGHPSNHFSGQLQRQLSDGRYLWLIIKAMGADAIAQGVQAEELEQWKDNKRSRLRWSQSGKPVDRVQYSGSWRMVFQGENHQQFPMFSKGQRINEFDGKTEW